MAPQREPREGCVPVAVDWRHLDEGEIDRYLALEQPVDCAGAAKCQGLGIEQLERIRTEDPTALIGLPLILVADALRHIGLAPT